MEERVGDYEVLEKLRTGRVTSIYAVRHLALGSEHVMRVLAPQWADQEAARTRFLELAAEQQAFEAAGLVRVTDAIEDPPAVVTDILQGPSVRERLEADGWIAPKEAVQIIADAAKALHAAGMPHGRLSARSLVLTSTGVKVVGFGQALPGVDPPLSTVGTEVASYQAPELAHGGIPSESSDVFSLGALLWEMLVGTPPFRGTTAFAALQATVEHEPGSPDRHGEVPNWLADVLGAALRKRPRERFSLQGFIEGLDRGPRGTQLPAVALPPPTPNSVRPLYVLSGLFGGAILLGALAIGSLALLVHFNRPAKIHDVTSGSDVCGASHIDVDVYSPEGTEVWVDQVLVHTESTEGRQQFVVPLQRDPGSTSQIEIRAGTDVRTHTLQVPGAPLSTRFETLGIQREGVLGLTRVHVEGSCVPAGLRYSASLNGAAGTYTGVLPIELDTRTLKQGRHSITLDLLDGAEVVHTDDAVVLVGEAPPPNDLDMDGHTKNVDCDDTNPDVFPGNREAAVANGIDDDCDGKIDEGTSAYDDDGDGVSEDDGDCDDNNDTVHPNMKERPDCLDQNCNGQIDEGITIPKRDDGFEPNDTVTKAHDLKTGSLRSFQRDLDLVAASTSDDAWFVFHSQDGDWDDWGIDVSIPRMPAQSSILLEVYDESGDPRGSLLVTEPHQELQVRGRAFRDDSGRYKLLVAPKTLVHDWCPVRVHVEAR